MVKRLYIPLPEGEARKQIICNLLQDQRYSLSEEDFEKLTQRSEGMAGLRIKPSSFELDENLEYSHDIFYTNPSLPGYSGSDMSNLCREAALGPIRSISGNIQAITPDQVL